MYSYIKPFIATQRRTWIHNATGRLGNPKISEKGTPMPWPYPARTSRQLPGWSKQSRPHPHAKHTHTHKHTRKRTCKHTCMFTIMPLLLPRHCGDIPQLLMESNRFLAHDVKPIQKYHPLPRNQTVSKSSNVVQWTNGQWSMDTTKWDIQVPAAAHG